MQEIESLGQNRPSRTLIACLILTSFLTALAVGQSAKTTRESPLDSLIDVGLDLTIMQQYDAALSHFAELSHRYPNHPAGPTYYLGTILSRSKDCQSLPERSVVDSLLDVATLRVGHLNSSPDLRLEGRYYEGALLGLDAHDRAERKEAWGAFLKARASASVLEGVIEQDSSWFDAYVGVGTYAYWRSRKTDFLNWLPFLSDRREEGIKLLNHAAEKSRHQRYAALLSLLWVYLDAGRYEEAESTARRLLERANSNRLALLGLGTALTRLRRNEEAAHVYKCLLESIQSSEANSPMNELVARVRLASVSLAIGSYDEARVQLTAIRGIESKSFPHHLRSQAQGNLAEARGLEQLLARNATSGK
jgi:tetratricopeptide (TPR) repeat protein